MTALETLDVLLQNLPNSTNVPLSLDELRVALTNVHPSDLATLAPQLSFSTLFGYLDTYDLNQLESCCDILKKFLEAVLPSVIMTNFRNELMAGLQHHSHYVVELCLTQISKILKYDVQQVADQSHIVKILVKLLASQQPGVVPKVSSCLVEMGSDSRGFQKLFSSDVLPSFKEVLQTDSVVKYRVYEVLIKIIIQRPESVNYFESGIQETYLLDAMVSELSPGNNDVLGKLNVLELASDLVTCLHGFNYLERRGFIVAMENSMEDALNDPFLANGYMKFFGSVCFVQPELVNCRFKNFINAMFSAILKGSHTISIAVESLGLIGSTSAGKMALQHSGQGMIKCLPVIGKLASASETDLGLKSLQSLQLLLVDDGKCQQTISTIVEEWFGHLGGHKILAEILSLCRQPFVDVKVSAFSVMKCLAMYSWGQRALKECAGFQEYLLDRSENTKEGVVGKYEIVKVLVHSPFTQEVLGDSYYLKLKSYEMEGPYYSPAVPHVALDNE